MAPELLNRPAAPGSPDWHRTVTASKIPIILGISPWQTPGELWMVMSGLTEPEHLDGDHLSWGHVAEKSLADWWAHHNPGWQLNQGGELAYHDPALPFPNQVTLDRRARRGRRFHLIECKTSDDTDRWDSPDELPPHVAAQVLAQQGVSGIHRGSVVAQLRSTVPVIFPVDWDPELWAGVVDTVADFYRSLGNSEPPAPPQDLLDALAASVVKAPADGEVDAPADLVDNYAATARALAEAKDDHEQSKRALLDYMAGNRKLTYRGKALATTSDGRFSTANVPKEARHLLTDPDVMVPKLDPAKFAEKYPDVYAAALGDASTRFYDKAVLS